MSFNTAEFLRQSRRLSYDEMKAWVERQTGVPMTKHAFEGICRDRLPPESVYQREIMEGLTARYKSAIVWKAAAGPYSRGGIPDICAVIGGRFYGFEVKRPYVGQLSRLQEVTLRQIKEAGGTAAVVSFPEQAMAVVEGRKVP